MWPGAECLPSIPEVLEALGRISGWRGEGWLGKRWEVLIVGSFAIFVWRKTIQRNENTVQSKKK